MGATRPERGLVTAADKRANLQATTIEQLLRRQIRRTFSTGLNL